MLVHNDQFADYDAHDVSAEIIKNFLEVTESSTGEDRREIKDLQSHDLIVQFMAALPTPVLHQYVMQLQSLMTMNIVAGGVPNYELIVVCVRMLDIFFWINQTFRDPIDQIEKKEFHNDAVNNNINLSNIIKEWANRTKV